MLSRVKRKSHSDTDAAAAAGAAAARSAVCMYYVIIGGRFARLYEYIVKYIQQKEKQQLQQQHLCLNNIFF